MSDLPTIFQFESRAVRSVMLAGAPWFVANDVCAILDIADARQALDKLDEDERGGCLVPTPSGQQEMRAVNESGLYTLILRCRGATTPGTLPHRFRKWVTSEVLPAIRKTGAYAPQTDRTDINLRMVAEARQTFGTVAARGLWADLGLPAVMWSAPVHRECSDLPEIARSTYLRERVAKTIRNQIGFCIGRGDLTKRLDGACKAHELDVVISDFLACGLITVTRRIGAKGGRPRTAYRWISDANRPAPVSPALPH